MRRSRIQVKPNIGARKPGPDKIITEKPPSAESKAPPDVEAKIEPHLTTEIPSGNKDVQDADNVILNKIDQSEIKGSKEKVTGTCNIETDKKDELNDTNPVSENKSKVNPDIDNQISGRDGPVAPDSKPSTATPLIRRSKVKPMVKLKPRVAPSAVRNTTDVTATPNSTNIPEKSKPETSDEPKPNKVLSEQFVSENVSKDSHETIRESDTTFTVIKPRPARDKTSEASVVNDHNASKTIGDHESQLDTSRVCVIQMNQEDTIVKDASLRDTTTVSVIKSEKLSQSQNNADNLKTSVPPVSSIITKVVPARRNRLVKPTPNLRESSHRKRSTSMSASDTDDEFTKKHMLSPPAKHVSSPVKSGQSPAKGVSSPFHHIVDCDVTSSKIPASKPKSAKGAANTKTEKFDDSSDSTDSSMPSARKKSFFKIQAEREREKRQNIVRTELRRPSEKPLEDPVDRSKMRICDLIYKNPTGNRMKSSIQEEERKKSQLERSINKVVNNDSDIGSPDRLSELRLCNAPSQSTDSVLEPNPEPVPQPTPEVVEDDDEPMMVPQVTIGADGQIIINEASLTVAQHNKSVVEEDVVEEYGNAAYNPRMYYRRNPKSKTWTWRETKRFYLALSVVGTDFSLMTNLFQGRNRLDLKKKFKKEEKVNRWLVDKALKDTKSYDISLFEQLSETEEEEEEKPKIKKEKRCRGKGKGNSEEKQPTKPKIKRTKPKAKNLYYECSSEDEKPKKKTKKKNAASDSEVAAQSAINLTTEFTKGASLTDDVSSEQTVVQGTAEGIPEKVKEILKAKKPRQKRKPKEKKDSDTNESENKTEKTPGEEKDDKPVKKKRKKKEDGTSTKRKKKDKDNKPALPPNISNLSPGQFFLVSADGNPQASQGNSGELIHMYVVDSQPDVPRSGSGDQSPMTIHPGTPGTGNHPIGKFPVPPGSETRTPRVHRDSINDAMTAVGDQESNPFSSFMAHKLMTSTSPRMRHHSGSTGVTMGNRDQESANKLTDLTVLGRSSDVQHLEQSRILHQQRQNIIPEPIDSGVMPIERPQIVSIVKLSESQTLQEPSIKQEKREENEHTRSLTHSNDQQTESPNNADSSGYIHLDLSSAQIINQPGQGYLQELNSPSTFPQNIPLVPTMTESCVEIDKSYEANGAIDLSYKKEPNSFSQVPLGLLGSGKAENMTLGNAFSSPPVAQRMAFADRTSVGSATSLNPGAISIPMPLTMVNPLTPSIVLMNPDMTNNCVIASTASLCFVPHNPAVMVASQAQEMTTTARKASSELVRSSNSADRVTFTTSGVIMSSNVEKTAYVSRDNSGLIPAVASSTQSLSNIKCEPKGEQYILPRSPVALQKIASRVFIDTVSHSGNRVDITSPTHITCEGLNTAPTTSDNAMFSPKHVPDSFSHLSPKYQRSRITSPPLLPNIPHGGRSPIRSGIKESIVHPPSMETPKSPKAMPSTWDGYVSSKMPDNKTRLPSATFQPAIKEKQAPKKPPQTKRRAKVLPQVHKFPKSRNKTRLPAATFEGSSDEDIGREQMASDEEQDVNQRPPEEWLDESKARCTSDAEGEGVQTIRIRILKSSERPPEKDKQNSGEINLFVG